MSSKEEIIEKLTQIVEQNLDKEGFGVEELAREYSVSKSTLLRTLKKFTGLSVNQFIKDVRLEQASLMLAESEKTIAEISFATGFSSPSYFIKCFKEKYGYSPGESRLIEHTHDEAQVSIKKTQFSKRTFLYVGLILLIGVSTWIFKEVMYQSPSFSGKSIAVLPFKNESADSSNVYFINGMMESILNHLQKIEEIRVISRTSVEKYRNMRISTPEIAVALGVDYVLEGSGQKSGEDVLLSVQLIEASEDRHLWSNQYKRKFSDVFKLQAEVSKKIAKEIEVVIHPQTQNQIEAIPTENMEAYDAFLVGLEFLQKQSESGLDSAVSQFKRAIELDPEYANPYAYIAICFYYKDLFKVDKVHLEEMDAYADRALLLNNKLPESIIARGLYYTLSNKYEEARDYFEKVLEYNPNSAWSHNLLSEIYHKYIPNTEKYLIHALLALQLDLTQSDSLDVSITHLILANAFAQSGMLEKANKHVKISLEYDQFNTISRYLSIFIDLVSENEGLDTAIIRMKEIYTDDTTRLDVIKELASLYYGKKDYPMTYHYYEKFTTAKELYGLNLFPDKDITIAFVSRAIGDTAKARVYRSNYQKFIDNNQTIYRPFLNSIALLYDDKNEEALDAFEEFSKTKDFMYWILLIKDDPMFENVKNNPRFLSIYQKMVTDFEERKQERIRQLKDLGIWE